MNTRARGGGVAINVSLQCSSDTENCHLLTYPRQRPGSSAWSRSRRLFFFCERVNACSCGGVRKLSDLASPLLEVGLNFDVLGSPRLLFLRSLLDLDLSGGSMQCRCTAKQYAYAKTTSLRSSELTTLCSRFAQNATNKQTNKHKHKDMKLL